MEIVENTASNEVWDLVWQTFENASMTYDLVSTQNGTKTNHEDIYLLDNPAKLGILTGFFIACVADFQIATPKFQLDACLEAKLRTITAFIINLISFIVLAPMVSTILIIFLVYRKIVESVVKFQLSDDFAGLLEGTDCVWALEESTGLSVINVLTVLEKNDSPNDEIFLSDFRNLIKTRLLSSNFDKLNWLREKKYGYFYWRKNSDIAIEERVRWIDENDDHEKCDGKCNDVNGNFLKTTLTEATNKPLPRDHSTCWEILVFKTCENLSSNIFRGTKDGFVGVESDVEDRKTTIRVLFRVHHCLGDGVALLRLLLESIADSETQNAGDHSQTASTLPIQISKAIETPKLEKNHQHVIRLPVLRKNSSMLGGLREDNEYVDYSNDLMSASMPFTAKIPIQVSVKSIFTAFDERFKFLNNLTIDDAQLKIFVSSLTIFGLNCFERFRENIKKLVTFMTAVISIPNCLVEQSLRSMDNSALHGPILTGKKFLSCWMESDVEDSQSVNLMSKIRDIKNATGTRFGDVILAALSDSLHHYFSKIGEAAPKSMTVVIPARMTAPSPKLNLQNGFSVGLHKLCISEVNGVDIGNDFAEIRELWERLADVSRSSEELRESSDYLINFWVMKWLSAALPEFVLKPVLESRSTLAFSNLPGPGRVTVLGYKLKNVAFWIPHRGSTGIGCSFLTYGEKVHFSIIADTALMRTPQLLDEIVRSTIENIEKLHDSIAL